jgi:hypothetical protein
MDVYPLVLYKTDELRTVSPRMYHVAAHNT